MLKINKKELKEKINFPLTLDNNTYMLLKKFSFDNNLSMNYIINQMISYSCSDFIDSKINKLMLLEFYEELENNSKIPDSEYIEIDYVLMRIKEILKGVE